MPELERVITVLAGADTTFEILSDPVRLPDYVSALRLDDSTAVDGELDVDADLDGRDGAPAAGFVADRATRRIDWGLPDAEYGGSIVVEQGTPSTARVTVRLRTGEAADAAAVAKVFEASVSSIRRILTGR